MSAARRVEAARGALEALCGLLTAPEMSPALQIAQAGLRACQESPRERRERLSDRERKRRRPTGIRPESGRNPASLNGSKIQGKKGGVGGGLSSELGLSLLSQNTQRTREAIRVLPELPAATLEPLTARARELADGVAMNAGIFDVADAWVAYLTSSQPRSDRAWQHWCANAARFAKRDRQRDKDRPRGPSVTRAEPGYQQPPPVWKGHAEPVGGAVPPPRDLLACLPGGRR